MSKQNRFEGLMGAVGKKSNVQTSKHRNVSKSTQNQEKKHLDAETFEHPDSPASSNSNIQTSKHRNVSTSTPNEEKKHLDVETSEHPGLPRSNNPDIQTSKKNKDVSNTKAPISKRSDVQMSKAKSANPDYVRTTIYIPKKMHKKLKAIAVEEEREMSEIMEELLDNWLQSK